MTPDLWSPRRPMLLGIAALVALVGGFGTWALTTQLAGAIIATGQIEVERNRQIVQHPDGGVISEILVKEGADVKKGQTLLRLEPTDLASQKAIIEAQLFEILARIDRLEAEASGENTLNFKPELREVAARKHDVASLLEGQRALFKVRREALDQEKAQLRERLEKTAAQVSGIKAQEQAVTQQLVLIKDELLTQQDLLKRGLTQTSRVLGLRREKERLRGQRAELDTLRAGTESTLSEIRIELLRLDTRTREAAITLLRDINAHARSLAEQRAGLRQKLARLDIRAPVGGIVYGLTVFAEQSVIQPAATLLYIVPQDRPLIISSRIPATHIDQIRQGQTVEVALQAFDSRTTPPLMGRVIALSPDAFVDEATRQNYYRAEIIFEDGELEKLSVAKVLIPGMPVAVFFRTDDRTAITYLTDPLLEYFTKALRES